MRGIDAIEEVIANAEQGMVACRIPREYDIQVYPDLPSGVPEITHILPRDRTGGGFSMPDGGLEGKGWWRQMWGGGKSDGGTDRGRNTRARRCTINPTRLINRSGGVEHLLRCLGQSKKPVACRLRRLVLGTKA